MSNTYIQPYLILNGRCEAALEFYRHALGAEVEMVMRYSESPEPMPPGALPPGSERMIMHSAFRIGDSLVMASDGRCEDTRISDVMLCLTLPTEADVDRAFGALLDGGTVTMPLGRTFWSPRFGMVVDKFGVGWMLTVPGDGG